MPDLIMVGDSLNVLLNLGNGTFAAPVAYPLPPSGSFIAVADMNGDGTLDIVVPATDGIEVLLNDGTGAFTLAGTYAAGPLGNCGAATVADLNGDGRPDVAVSCQISLTILFATGCPF